VFHPISVPAQLPKSNNKFDGFSTPQSGRRACFWGSTHSPKKCKGTPSPTSPSSALHLPLNILIRDLRGVALVPDPPLTVFFASSPQPETHLNLSQDVDPPFGSMPPWTSSSYCPALNPEDYAWSPFNTYIRCISHSIVNCLCLLAVSTKFLDSWVFFCTLVKMSSYKIRLLTMFFLCLPPFMMAFKHPSPPDPEQHRAIFDAFSAFVPTLFSEALTYDECTERIFL